MKWFAKLDKREDRGAKWATGTLEPATTPRGEEIFILKEWPKEFGSDLFIIDNGTSARIMYTAGYSVRNQTIILGDIPVNPDGQTRPDNGRNVDYRGWHLGPSKTYHLKVTE